VRQLLTAIGVAASVLIIPACDPAIYRSTGTVVSIENHSEDEVTVCLTGDDCSSGILDGDMPKVGDCVTLQTQGESAMLKITSARGC
jgi:hypothetical protein